MQVIISGFISAGNISQQFFHALNCFFRSGDPDLLPLGKYPRVESIAQRNGDDDLGVSLIVVRNHDITAKSIDNQIHAHSETEGIGDNAMNALTNTMLIAQNAEMDTVAGATMSSVAFKEAVANCIAQAAK